MTCAATGVELKIKSEKLKITIKNLKVYNFTLLFFIFIFWFSVLYAICLFAIDSLFVDLPPHRSRDSRCRVGNRFRWLGAG